MSIFEGKFMLFIKSHGPINVPSGQEKPELVGFNWDIPPATFTWKDGILETDGNHLGIFHGLGPGRSLFHIPWMRGVEAQKVRFEARGRGYMMRINGMFRTTIFELIGRYHG